MHTTPIVRYISIPSPKHTSERVMHDSADTADPVNHEVVKFGPCLNPYQKIYHCINLRAVEFIIVIDYSGNFILWQCFRIISQLIDYLIKNYVVNEF